MPPQPPFHPSKDDALIALPYIRARSLLTSRIAAIACGIWFVPMLILAGLAISGPITLSAFFLPILAPLPPHSPPRGDGT